jgi:integrase
MKLINLINNNGSIQLKVTVAGKRYSFNPIPGAAYGDRRAMDTVRAIANRVNNDRLSGHFDPTLDRYRLETKATPVKVPNSDLLSVWDEWVEGLELAPATQADHYEMIRRMIVKAAPSVQTVSWFTVTAIAPSTFNKRLGYLRSCLKWAIKAGRASENPWEAVKPRKGCPNPIKPFTAKEIASVCSGFDEIAPHYAPFIRFLFLTGCRLSEAIGIRWSNVDRASLTLTISESLSVDRTGNGYKRVRKGTKTDSIRHLDISPTLRALLKSLGATRASEALLFTSPTGCPIASQNFRATWVKVLKAQSIPYRRVHIIRHTVLSMAVEQGTPLTGVAYLAGHKNTRMVMTTYGHMVNRPQLPEMSLELPKSD